MTPYRHACIVTGEGQRGGRIRTMIKTTAEIIEALDAITGDDPEHAHGQADDLLLEAVPAEVRDAYKRVAGRCEWWAGA